MLGLDLWVIPLFGTLPDPGLKVLLSILSLALRGKIPMQMLLTLIGLMPKPDGGERPIALTAMLYIQGLHEIVQGDMRPLGPECTWMDYHSGTLGAAGMVLYLQIAQR